MKTLKRALISVSDKNGVLELAAALAQYGVEILSTGGTASLLAEAGYAVTEVSAHTGFPEMMEGRVKTLHPTIHGGILAKRSHPDHVAAMQQHGIAPIDLVCVNLYPFERTVASGTATLEVAIENIDIGGPAMIRSAAKNWGDVAVLTSPEDYQTVIDELHQHSGALSSPTRFQLAKRAFSHTAAYDGAISQYLNALATPEAQAQPFSDVLNLQFVKAEDLRYGENPHQAGAFYREKSVKAGSIASSVQLQGKPLSYNNIADADAAWEMAKSLADLPQTACVIVKHANPCGVALGDTALSAYQRAFATDPTSAFGGIIAFNRPVDAATVAAVTQQFLEVLIAPAFSPEALALIAEKKNVRVLQIECLPASNALDYKRVGGGLLVQHSDTRSVLPAEFQVVSRRQPSVSEMSDLLFAWRVAKYVKSNAIIFAQAGQTLGIGAGQMSRVDSTHIAAKKAHEGGFILNGAVAASDAFFPFRDGIDVIAKQGIKAIIQPGGSIKDEAVFAAADEHDIAMILTGVRHFRH
jgi:phosphoribosylaminoimidazolecarboxamide formyltransferase/IMP cyclohydrolase